MNRDGVLNAAMQELVAATVERTLLLEKEETARQDLSDVKVATPAARERVKRADAALRKLLRGVR